MPLVDKAKILCSLKEFWQESSVEFAPAQFGTFKIDVATTSLASLCLHVRNKKMIYRRSKDGSEALALGELYRHESPTERSQTLQILAANSQLHLYFVARFEPDGIKAPEWAHFGKELGIIPIVEWETKLTKTTLKINYPREIHNDPEARAKFLFQVDELLDFMPEIDSRVHFTSMSESPTEEVWCQAIDNLALALSCLEAPEDPDKVVMARKRIIRAKNLIDPQVIFKEMAADNLDGHIFFFKIDDHRAFLSFTPERLFQFKEQRVEVDVIAGTRPRGSHPDEDQAYAEDLMNSPKELEEHRIVAHEIERKLSGFCQDVKATAKEELLRLKHVQHIQGRYQGRVPSGVNQFEIMEYLHPTPAVGGRPWPAAKKYIEMYERFDRGLYAGPCGLVSDTNTDLMVGIRSIVIYQDEVHIYGGAGIVAGSKGKNEWIETHNKMKNFKIALS